MISDLSNFQTSKRKSTSGIRSKIDLSRVLLLVPAYALLKGYARPSKHIERTPNSEIDSAMTKPFDKIEILQISSTTSISHRYAAPLGKLLYQLLVNTLLEAFIICGMYQELGTVWLQRLN